MCGKTISIRVQIDMLDWFSKCHLHLSNSTKAKIWTLSPSPQNFKMQQSVCLSGKIVRKNVDDIKVLAAAQQVDIFI